MGVPPKTLYSDWRAQIRPEPRGTQDSLDVGLHCPHCGRNILLTHEPGRAVRYGHDAMVAAIGRNLSEDKAEWQAISYRFVHDARGSRVFVSIAIPDVAVNSHRQAGVIGVGINADRLAVIDTDRFGNPVGSWVIDCVTYARTSERRVAIVGDAVKQVVAIAVDRRKPIAIEKLDFWKKRATLSGKHARMLCAFAYRRIQSVIRARSYEAGIVVAATNPAYRSLIGKYKFASRYGLSAHNAESLCPSAES